MTHLARIATYVSGLAFLLAGLTSAYGAMTATAVLSVVCVLSAVIATTLWLKEDKCCSRD